MKSAWANWLIASTFFNSITEIVWPWEVIGVGYIFGEIAYCVEIYYETPSSLKHPFTYFSAFAVYLLFLQVFPVTVQPHSGNKIETCSPWHDLNNNQIMLLNWKGKLYKHFARCKIDTNKQDACLYISHRFRKRLHNKICSCSSHLSLTWLSPLICFPRP